jgi:hypothetical protein
MSKMENDKMSKLTDKEKAQLIFNRIWEGFEKQEWRRSYKSPLGCMYRNDNGDKCAAGQLIDDKFYDPEMECSISTNPIVNKAIEASLGFDIGEGAVKNFIRKCQIEHDESSGGVEMLTRFRTLARNYDLQIPNS